MLSPVELHSLFEYHPDTGHLYWKPRSHVGGKLAGYVQRSKHRTRIDIEYQGKGYRAHRIVWVMHYGPIPKGMEVDHLDHDGTNNRLQNLRLVSHADNMRNQRRSSVNTSGTFGVHWHKRDKCWEGVAGGIYVGRYADYSAAASAVLHMRDKLGFHPNHGT